MSFVYRCYLPLSTTVLGRRMALDSATYSWPCENIFCKARFPDVPWMIARVIFYRATAKQYWTRNCRKWKPTIGNASPALQLNRVRCIFAPFHATIAIRRNRYSLVMFTIWYGFPFTCPFSESRWRRTITMKPFLSLQGDLRKQIRSWKC